MQPDQDRLREEVEAWLSNFKHGNGNAGREIMALIAREVRLARWDELNRVNTRRHYGKDYQDSLDELDEYKDKRLAELSKENGV